MHYIVYTAAICLKNDDSTNNEEETCVRVTHQKRYKCTHRKPKNEVHTMKKNIRLNDIEDPPSRNHCFNGTQIA